jgi:hypothetical protein
MFDLLIEIYFLHLYFLYCTYWVVSSLFIYLLGAIEHKLFVASLNKQATAKEIEEVRVCCSKEGYVDLELIYPRPM